MKKTKTVAGVLANRTGERLTRQCRLYAVSRHLLKAGEKLLVEYVFNDGSKIIKDF